MQTAKDFSMPDLQPSQTLDCRGMQCPAPILELSKAARAYGKQPTVLEILVDDAEFPTDLRAWCRASKNTVLSIIEDEGLFVAHVGLNIRADDKSPTSGHRPVSPPARATHSEPARGGGQPSAQVALAAAPVSAVAPSLSAANIVSLAVDCRGMQCPAPILAVAKKAQQVARDGGLLEIVATDEQFPTDIRAWCRASKAQLVSVEQVGREFRAMVAVGNVPPEVIAAALNPPSAQEVTVPLVNVRQVKAPVQGAPVPDMALKPTLPDLPRAQPNTAVAAPPSTDARRVAYVQEPPTALVTTPLSQSEQSPHPAQFALDAQSQDPSGQVVPRENRCTILIIKNDFESLMAAMMCASTAAAQGMETAIFFSFWGVNVLRAETPRPRAPKEKVSFLQKMMQWMMPKGPARQKMSKMHMAGMGKGMMQYFMRRNNVLSLEELVMSAAEQNVKFIVCAMSMGIMGIQKRDIVDMPNVEFAGVATFVELSRRSAMTMVF